MFAPKKNVEQKILQYTAEMKGWKNAGHLKISSTVLTCGVWWGVGLESLVWWSRSAKLGRDSITMHFKFLECLQYCSLTLQIGIAVFQEQVHPSYTYILILYIYMYIYSSIYLHIWILDHPANDVHQRLLNLWVWSGVLPYPPLTLVAFLIPLCLMVRFDFMWLMPL